MGEGAWIAPLAGGALIGAAAALMMGLHGRIAGISGVLGGILTGDRALWRGLFVGGLVAGGLLMSQLMPSAFPSESSRSMAALIVAGLAVGVGTRMGNGCTSGHGVCGIARGSRRSIVATVTFIATGALTVWVVGALGGHV